MKILSAKEIRAADKFTIDNEPVMSIDLMERAAERLVERITTYFPSLTTSFSIFCGVGNNGGDGLVIYRLLKSKGYLANCYIVHFSDKNSADFLTNKVRLEEQGLPLQSIHQWDTNQITFNDVIIDAVLGVGTDRPAQGLLADYIQTVNAIDAFTVSIDLPTGMFSDQSNQIEDPIFKADLVLTLAQPKLGLFLPPNENYYGDFEVVPIGLDEALISSIPNTPLLLTDRKISEIKKTIKKTNHKGTMGHLAVVAGQKGMMGAAVLAAQAAMRSGLGKCTVYCPSIGRNIVQVSCPEVLVNDECGIDFLQHCPDDLSSFDALAVGPGIGQRTATQNSLEKLLNSSALPKLVIDADGLNIIANKDGVKSLPKNTIITPHPGEFSRLFGATKNRLESIKRQRKIAQKHGIIIVLKGHHTTISLPNGDVYINHTGNAGMATAGSGDVLTGIIGALLAQGYTPEEAALLGVYTHGLSGDLALENHAIESIIASDIIHFLSKSFKML